MSWIDLHCDMVCLFSLVPKNVYSVASPPGQKTFK